MEGEDEIMDERQKAKQVRIVGMTLGTIHERPELVDFDKTEYPQDGFEAQGEVEKVQRE